MCCCSWLLPPTSPCPTSRHRYHYTMYEGQSICYTVVNYSLLVLTCKPVIITTLLYIFVGMSSSVCGSLTSIGMCSSVRELSAHSLISMSSLVGEGSFFTNHGGFDCTNFRQGMVVGMGPSKSSMGSWPEWAPHQCVVSHWEEFMWQCSEMLALPIFWQWK